jgi:uncharacterized protein (TIGR03437 family)
MPHKRVPGLLPLALAIAVIFSGTIAPAATCISAPSGLVGWWPGDTNNNDITGGNNPSAATGVSLVPGEVLDGFSFATKGYILIPSSASLANQQFTWLAWIRPDGPTLGGDKSNDNLGSIIVGQNTDASDFAVSLSWRSIDSRFVFSFGNFGSASGVITSADPFPAGQFYLIAGTYDGSVFRLFVNGMAEAALSEAKTVDYSSSGWTFGSNLPKYFAGGGLYTRTFNGVIDEMQAFNHALSTAELLLIYNAGSAGECKDTLSIGSVISASAFGGFKSISPGSWIEIYGTALAADTRGWTGSDFNGINAPTSLDDTSVTVGGQEAFVDYISPGQVNALVPSNVSTGLQQITVTNAAGISLPFTAMVNSEEPGLLASAPFNISGTQYVVAQFADGTYVLPAGAIPSLTSRPAKPGDTIVIYGVGFGPVTPNSPAGQIVQQDNTLSSSFQLSIGGMPASAAYAGLAANYTGLYQFDVVVPNVAAGNAVPLTFTLNGVAGAQALYLPVTN